MSSDANFIEVELQGGGKATVCVENVVLVLPAPNGSSIYLSDEGEDALIVQTAYTQDRVTKMIEQVSDIVR